MKDAKKGYIYFLRLLIGLVLFSILLILVDFEHLPNFNEIRLSYIGWAFLLVFFDRFLCAYRWSILIKSKGIRITFKKILSIYFKSIFLGLVLPSNVGGEFLKGYGLFNATSNAVESLTSVIVERILGFIALTAICIASYFVLQDGLKNNTVILLIRNICIIGLLATISFLIFGNYFEKLIERIPLKLTGKISSFMHKAWISVCEYRKEKLAVLLVFSLTLISQLIRILLVWSVGMGIAMNSTFSYYLIFVPFTALVSTVPISLSGIGVQEGAFVYLFSLTGVENARIFSMAILVRILTVASVLPGLWFYVGEGLQKKANKPFRGILKRKPEKR